jgi:Na+-translocating ferredoxin:NAD+ oxidoreductase RnfC subunit
MEEIELKVQASVGLSVKVGDHVNPNDKIGNALRSKQPVKTPIRGIIKRINFCPRDHSFLVTIEKR